jgi:adenylyltransferase/sulfurtransferase
MKVKRNPACPTCGQKKFEFLEKRNADSTAALCGRNAVQITPGRETRLDLKNMEKRFKKIGKAVFNKYLLEMETEGFKMMIFPDARAIIYGTTDESKARDLYRRYLGK